MAKRKKLSFYQKVLRIKQAGLGTGCELSYVNVERQGLSIDEKQKLMEEFMATMKRKRSDEVYAFILYDIENDKIRTHVAKYLIRNSCTRVQKSVFIAGLKRKKYMEIFNTLKEINAMYDNHDSIFFIPVGEDILNKMKMLGRNVDFELVVYPGSTLVI